MAGSAGSQQQTGRSLFFWGRLRSLRLLLRSLRLLLRNLRVPGLDLLIFGTLMLIKLQLFNAWIAVRNMEQFTSDDKLVAIGTLGVLSGWMLLLNARRRWQLLLLFNLLLTGLLYADLLYFRYFQDLISISLIGQLGQIGALGGSIGLLPQGADLLLFIDLLVLFPVWLLWSRSRRIRRVGTVRLPGNSRSQRGSNRAKLSAPKRLTPQSSVHQPPAPQQSMLRKRRKQRSMSVRLFSAVAVTALSLVLVLMPIEKAKNGYALGLFVGNWWNLSIYNVTGLFGFHAYDVYRYTEQHVLNRQALGTQAAAETTQELDRRAQLRKQLEQNAGFGAYKGSNVVMVQVEALHAFIIGQRYMEQEITPVLNALVQESAYFNHFYHQTALGRTSDADLAAHCSVHPSSTGSVFIRFPDHELDCLPELLKDAQYRTSVFHAYEGGFWNRNTMYSNMGYDLFMSKKHYTMDEPLGWSLGDKSFFRQSLAVLSEQPTPFYSFFITLSSHHPFTLPEEKQQLELGELAGTVFGDYLQSIHYADAAIGELVARLKQEKLWDSTIFVLYGDHDNSIKDFSLFEAFLGHELNELEKLEVMKRVPLIMHLPDGARSGVHTQPGGQLDLAPTIAYLLGIGSEKAGWLGYPLLTDQVISAREVVFRNGSFTDGQLFYMPSVNGRFDSGSCFGLPVGTRLPIERCEAGALRAEKELVHSDRIVERNLLKPFNKSF